MHYPIERVRRQDASHITPRKFSPLEDLLILDTSAFGSKHAHLLVEFMNRGGTLIIPSPVNAEIAELAEHTYSKRGTGTNETAGRHRIPLNAKAIFHEANVRKRNLIVNYADDTETRSQVRLCEALAGILPKRHAYLLTRKHHAEWHCTLGNALAFHLARGKQIALEDIRNHESGAYRLLELITTPTDGMPADLAKGLAQIQEHISAAQAAYTQRLSALFGAEALLIPSGKKPLGENYDTSFQEKASSILLRLLGYHLDPEAPKHSAYALEGTARRFAPRDQDQSADASCVVFSYTLPQEPRKNRHIYSADRDIEQILELRKFCHDHREARKNVYRAINIERESQRLPKQA